MEWNTHWRLKGKHALLSASQNAWMRYDEDKIRNYYSSIQATAYGTEMHNLAETMIKLKQLPHETSILYPYVKFALDNKLDTEQLLYADDTCFGTADGIRYDEDNKKLIIADLKTGKKEVDHFYQLEIYAAMFAVEYPLCEIEQIDLHIYQFDFEPKHKTMTFDELEVVKEQLLKQITLFKEGIKHYDKN